MSRVIDKQRCFKIPKQKLDLFLVKLNMSSDRLLKVEAAYIFQNETEYDVIVNYFGSYPYVEDDIEKFATSLAEDKK